MDEKERWESRTLEEKKEATIFKILFEDFDDERIKDADLDEAVYQIGNLDDREAVNKIKALPGFKIWVTENEEKIKHSILQWEKRMKKIFA